MEEAQERSNCERDALEDVPYVAVDTELEARPAPGEPEQVPTATAKSPGDGAAPAAVTAQARARNWTRAVAGCTPKEIAKKAVFCAAILVVWMALAIPTVMFYLPQV